MTYRSVVIAVVLILLGASTCLALGPFTGTWESEISLSPQQTMPFTSFTSTLDVSFHIGFLEVSSSSDFISSGWLWQEFGLCASLGFVSFDGVLLFEPQAGSFLYTQGALTFNFYPLIMKIYSAMTSPLTSHGLNYGYVLDIYGELLNGYASFESATFLGADLSGITFVQTASNTSSTLLTKTYLTDPTSDSACLCFSGEEFTFKAALFSCIDLTSVTTFAKTGFESQEIELSFIHLFGLPLNLTLNYVFSLQTASHTFTPSIETNYGCLKIYSGILGSGGQITGIEIYGVAFQASFAGTTFTSISNLNTTDYVITTPAYGSIIELESDAIDGGHLFYAQEYWEIISLAVETPVLGMGGSFTFSVSTFFSTSTGLLFDWGKSEMGVTLNLGKAFSATSTVIIDTTGFSEWKISMTVSW